MIVSGAIINGADGKPQLQKVLTGAYRGEYFMRPNGYIMRHLTAKAAQIGLSGRQLKKVRKARQREQRTSANG
jgi:hypothetical protein